MTESYAGKVSRETRETEITIAYQAGDSDLMNTKLDHYPYGERRTDVSTETAHHIGHLAGLPNDKQPTQEFEVITPEMLEGRGHE